MRARGPTHPACASATAPALALLACVALTATHARAQSITNFTVGKNGADSPNATYSGPRREFWSNAYELGTPEADDFLARYKSTLGVDVSGVGNTESEFADSSYFVSFTIDADPGEAWKLKLGSWRRGAYTINGDAGGYGTSEITTPVTATINIGGNVSSIPAFQFAGASHANGPAVNSDDADWPIDDALQEVFFQGFGTQQVRVDFSWHANVISHGALLFGGDEASVRLGEQTHLDHFTAGNYPGEIGTPRTNGLLESDLGDGHFLRVNLCATPAVGIAVNGIPTSSTTICRGSSVQLSAIGGHGSTAHWFSECCCGTTVPGNGASITVAPTQTTTYFMRWDSPSCGPSPCAAGVTIVVVQPPGDPLTATASPTTDVCEDTPVVLQCFGGGATGATLQWYAGTIASGNEAGTGTVLPIVATQTTRYYARWENDPCPPSAPVHIDINVTPKPLDPIGASALPSNVCANGPTQLTLEGGGNGTVVWYSGSCGGTYVGSGSPLPVSPGTTTRYFGRWENPPCAPSSCKDVEVVVTDPPPPPTQVVANPPTICGGEETILTASVQPGQNVVWTKNSPTGPLVGTDNPISVSPMVDTTYYAHCEASPCAASAPASTTVTVLTPNSAPDFISAVPNVVCAGTGTILLSASGGNGTGYEWFANTCGGVSIGEGSSISVPAPMSDTVYFVRRISRTCPPSPTCISTPVTVVQPPTAPTSITLPHSICADSSTTLTASGGSGDLIYWYAGSTSNPSIGQGPSIVVTPASTTTYFAQMERLPCGMSTPISTTVTVDVVPSTPTFASATPNLVCAGVGTIVLDVVGNGPGVFEWYADSCGRTYLGSGRSLTLPAPLADTTYFVRRSNGACSPSGCISVAVDTEATPVNDDPSSPITLVAETRRFNTTCAHDDVLLGSTLVRSVVFNYTAPISACGTVQVSVSPPSEKGVAIYADPLGATTPVATGIGSAVFQAAPGQVYTIFAGDVGAASGVGFITIIEDVGVPSAATFTLGGTASGSAWSWRISSNQTGFPGPSDFETLLTGNVSGAAVPPPGASATLIAQAFAASINAAAGACANDHIAAYASLFFPVLSIAYDERPTPPGWGIRLEIGPFPGTPNCLVDSTGTDCTFFLPLMSIHREVLPGEDCNENGFDDVIDVLAGTSVDADGNGIPDECSNNTAAAYCFGDGTGEFCPCGNNGAHGRGCANSQNIGGAKLSAVGAARVANDSVVLQATGMTGGTAIFFQGGSALPPFTVDDGLGCVGGPIIRLGTKAVTANSSSFPAPGDPLVSVRGQLPPAGGTRYYQCFYRNAASAFCPPATSNRTNGLIIDWRP